tara:strand:+ start:208 stop:414 length:207 start_codon:yes stop_codon:yes gene_type:complete
MVLYPKIDDLSILIDKDCKRMLRRTSRKLIIDEVLNKLFNDEKKYKKVKYNSCFYEMIINIFGCNLKE